MAWVGASMFRHTVRKLCRFPGFTLTSILVLAMGIGATSAIFSVVYGVLIQPLPYPQPERLITLTHRSENTHQARLPASTAIYFTYRDQNRSFDSVALWTSGTATITGAGSPEDVRIALNEREHSRRRALDRAPRGL